jgi:hypothetical protein
MIRSGMEPHLEVAAEKHPQRIVAFDNDGFKNMNDWVSFPHPLLLIFIKHK